jgi:hypothetical protein
MPRDAGRRGSACPARDSSRSGTTRARRASKSSRSCCASSSRASRSHVATGASGEWKGIARYLSLRVGDRRAADAAWTYPDPDPGYEALRDHLAFFPARVDTCWVGEDPVRAQPGPYYGGWITRELIGPFKGDPGTEDW